LKTLKMSGIHQVATREGPFGDTVFGGFLFT
jgi:hypothetical protein